MGFPQKIAKSLRHFNYSSPETLSEAVSIINELDGTGRIIAGGTDLLLSLKYWTEHPESLVNLKKIKDLDFIRSEGQELKIGALTKISTIGRSEIVKEKYTSLYEATKTFATPQIKNMATIGGNICRCSPCADMVPPLITFDAKVKLVGPKGERKLLLEQFITGSGFNVLESEILTEIIIPPIGKQYGTAFMKLMRTSVDLSKVNCAVKISTKAGKCYDIKISLGSVADRPVRAREAEKVIRGKEITDAIIGKTSQEVIKDISPITDVRSTADYRNLASKVLVKRLIKQALLRNNTSRKQ